MSRFTDIEPTLENYWRGVILFGLNVASYKFALGKSLLDLSKRDSDFVSLQDLGERFSFHIAQHVKTHPKQSTRKDPVKFFELCKQFNRELWISPSLLILRLSIVLTMSLTDSTSSTERKYPGVSI